MKQTTAILLFSRSALAEAAHKPLAGARDRDVVATTLLQNARTTLRRSGLPVFHLDERQQRGTTFGERLTNGMADVFARGYDRLLVVGGDCPAYTAGDLRRAAAHLETRDTILAPDRRGGVWLLGMTRGTFDAALLAGQPWQTDKLYAALRSTFADCGRLRTLHDVNTAAELLRLLRLHPGLLPRLHFLLGGPVRFAERPIPAPRTHARATAGRAPPRAA